MSPTPPVANFLEPYFEGASAVGITEGPDLDLDCVVIDNFLKVNLPSSVWGFGNPGAYADVNLAKVAEYTEIDVAPEVAIPSETFISLDRVQDYGSYVSVNFAVAFREDWKYEEGQTAIVSVVKKDGSQAFIQFTIVN